MKNVTAQQSFFDQKAKDWSRRSNKYDLERLSKIFKDRLSLIKPPILDVGSGTGILLDQLYEVNQHPLPVIELDLSLQMLIENKNKNGRKYPTFYLQTNVENLPIKADTINSIICFASFAHFMDKKEILQNFFRVLKSRGCLTILHLMCHRRLNHLHHNAGLPVRNDRLPPLEELSDLIRSVGFVITDKEENKNIYLITAQK